jgi:streptomycin 6-kinase
VRRHWLASLPALVNDLRRRWALTLGEPFDGDEGSCAWVAPVARRDGSVAVLKLGMPHLEGEHEIDGLRFWNGDPTVRLLEADDRRGAMLLERCEPGTSLRALAEDDQDAIVAGLLRRLWRTPPDPHPFRPLSELIASWRAETERAAARWPDDGLVREGVRVLDALAAGTQHAVLLATDLHAGNILRASREPWLAIDPKPFIGDPAYDATQHLLNCEVRLAAAPLDTIARVADLAEVDPERLRLWTFARAAAEPRDDWNDARLPRIARATAPSM